MSVQSISPYVHLYFSSSFDETWYVGSCSVVRYAVPEFVQLLWHMIGQSYKINYFSKCLFSYDIARATELNTYNESIGKSSWQSRHFEVGRKISLSRKWSRFCASLLWYCCFRERGWPAKVIFGSSLSDELWDACWTWHNLNNIGKLAS